MKFFTTLLGFFRSVYHWFVKVKQHVHITDADGDGKPDLLITTDVKVDVTSKSTKNGVDKDDRSE